MHSPLWRVASYPVRVSKTFRHKAALKHRCRNRLGKAGYPQIYPSQLKLTFPDCGMA